MSHLRNFLQRCDRSALIFNGSPQRSYSKKANKQAERRKLETFEIGKDGSGKSIGDIEVDENLLCFLRLCQERKSDAEKKWKSSSRATIFGKYASRRSRPLNPVLNPETVSLLKYPFEPSIAPAGVSLGSYVSRLENAKVYLVGTCHVSKESQKDVKETILQTQPDVVFVEWCPFSSSRFFKDECREETKSSIGNLKHRLQHINAFGLVDGIRSFSDADDYARMSKALDTEGGGEFCAAFNASLEVPNCQFVLGDRPQIITLQRLYSQENFEKKKSLSSKPNQSQLNLEKYGNTLAECIEGMKKEDAMEEIMKVSAENRPHWHKTISVERDKYMTYVLQKLLERTTAEKITAARQAGVSSYEPVTIVAVVGLAHVAGIKANWNSKLLLADIRKLLRVPKPSRIRKPLKWVFIIACSGGAFFFVYDCYRRFGVSKGNEEVSKKKADEELLAISDEEEF